MIDLDPDSVDPAVKHAWEQAVRLRLHEVDEQPDDPSRRRARRCSLDALHYAISEGGQIDGVQLRLLLELVDRYGSTVAAEPMPFWPGAQYGFLVRQLQTEQGVAAARSRLQDRLDDYVAQLEAEQARHTRRR